MGPAEQAVLGLLDEPVAAEAVPRSKLGDIRLDLQSLPSLRVAASPSREELDGAAARVGRTLVASPAIDDVAYVRPRVYIRTALPFLADTVLGAVERDDAAYGALPPGTRDDVLLTFTDPNANKPLHIGHLRNLFLGSALSGLHALRGHRTRREGTFGDWGVHMCQALLLYLADGATVTPEDAGTKPDHFVGELYQRYHQGGDEELEDDAARDLLVALEHGDPRAETHERLTQWALDGITSTYRRVGLQMDALFREFDYLDAARAAMQEGLAAGRLKQRADGCIYFDDVDNETERVLVRPDGTLLVYAQMMGIDNERWRDRSDRIISIFGHQWESAALSYREVGRHLGQPWASRYEPVFYGMVRLKEGSMWSREGRAVTADDALDQLAAALPSHVGEVVGATPDDIAVAVLRYFLLRQARTKVVVFDWDALLGQAVPTFLRALHAAYDPPASTGVTVDYAGLGQKPAAAVRRVLMAVNGFGSACDDAVERRDPSVVLHFVEELLSLSEQVPASAMDDRLRRAVAAVVRQGLTALEIAPAQWAGRRGELAWTRSG